MIAFIFPGQGSQKPSMGEPWLNTESFDLVYEACKTLDQDLAKLLLSTQEEHLQETNNQQVAILLTSLVILDAIEQIGLEPQICAGHSLGEYSALIAAGILSLEDGLKLVLERSQAMQKASTSTNGAMAALLGIDAKGAEIATRATTDVWVANDNSFEQVVIAGNKDNLIIAGEEARALGAKRFVPLKVSGAFHTPYMLSARPYLKDALERARFEPSQTKVVANLDAQFHDDPGHWPKLLYYQLTSCVRWRESMEKIVSSNVYLVAELGPSSVLTNLAKRSFKSSSINFISIEKPDDVQTLVRLASKLEFADKSEVNSPEAFNAKAKIIVSPANGIIELEEIYETQCPSPKSTFMNSSPIDSHLLIDVGQRLGKVGETEVYSPFKGRLISLLVNSNDRVARGQPLAYLIES